MYIPYTIHIK